MAEANAWMTYVQQVLDKYDWNTMEPIYTGACEAAAIYGQDGSAWAWSPNFPELLPQSVTIEGMSAADTKTVQVDEFQCALQAADGNRNPSDAGIRMGNQKFMFVAKDDVTGVVILSKRGGGGAALAKTNTALLIAFYEKDKPSSDPKYVQTAGVCAQQVADMCAYLKDQGY